MKESQNPTAIASRKRMIDSCIDLMQVKDFKDITISEITENAEVVRRTFYRNFDSKEEILQYHMQTLAAEFSQKVQQLNAPDCDKSIRILLRICKEHQAFFAALERNNMLLTMLEKWTELLPEIHQLVADRLINFPKTEDPLALEYLLAFNVGGTFNIVLKWMREGMKQTPDQVADLIKQISNYL